MKDYLVETKLPRGQQNSVLDIIVGVLVVFGLIMIISNIFNGGGVSIIGVIILILGCIYIFGIRRMRGIDYDFQNAHIKFFDDVMKVQYDTSQIVTMERGAIESAEYHTKLGYLRFVADYTFEENEKEQSFEKTNFVFYIEKEKYRDFFDALQEYMGQEIPVME